MNENMVGNQAKYGIDWTRTMH